MLVLFFFRIVFLVIPGCFRSVTSLAEGHYNLRWNGTNDSIHSNNGNDSIGSVNQPRPAQPFDSSNNESRILQQGHTTFQNDSLRQPTVRSSMKQQQRRQRYLLFHLFCVRTEAQLRNAVNNAATSGPKYTRINICTRNLKITEPDNVDPMMMLSGVDVSDKWIDLQCTKLFGRCTLDGQGLYSIIYGINTNLKMHRIDITNGRSYKFGLSAIWLRESKVKISQSTFRNNIGAYTSALLVSSEEDNGATSLSLQDVTFEINNGFVSTRWLIEPYSQLSFVCLYICLFVCCYLT
jgi:hypothetical protein